MRIFFLTLRLCGAFLFAVILGCASYQSQVDRARAALASGQHEKALEILEKKANEEGKDQVVYLLDYGLALHQAQDFKKSTEVLIRAQDLAEIKDYTSISREAGSLITSERLLQYKSERFENILINAYLALNFLMEGNYEEAVVECRKMDEKLYKFQMEGEKVAKNFFARYLSAMLWEADKNWDSAYIDYQNAYAINPQLPYLKEDLIRSAWRARRPDTLKQWQKTFPTVDLAKIKKEVAEKGEIVFVYQQGWVPRKFARPEDHRFPEMRRHRGKYSHAELVINGQQPEMTKMTYNVADDAIYTLDAQYKILVAKKIAGTAAKLVIADQINQKQEGLGTLAYILMQAADQADLRQWSTLPESFQVARLKLLPGTYQVQIQAMGDFGEDSVWTGDLEVKAGQKTFFTHRTY